ncbi:alpha/beta hydrolase [Pseudonocardia sp.]|uniref:alpha/beta hydrolase n=1 Tax=Pseudonocardia sp. TaxID=60912 RepID=UPI003D135F14
MMPPIDPIASLPIVAWWPVRTLLLVLALGCVGFAVVALRSGSALRRAVAAALTMILLMLNAGAAVNAYYAYFPTLGEALGGAVSDETTLAAADADEGRVPAAGVVVPVTIPGTASGFVGRQAQVYLPPAWFARPRPQLPVILLLHGIPGGPTDWTEGGDAAATADAFAAAHGGAAPVLVMPDVNGSDVNDTECVNSPRGNIETYLTEDVPAAVVATFATHPPGPGTWAIAGLSEGGMCAIMLALRHPALFGTFGDFGGLLGPRVGDTNDDPDAATVTTLFGGSQSAYDAHQPQLLLADPGPGVPGMGGWFQAGSDDPLPLAAAQILAPLARRAGIETCLVVVPGGGHTFDVWSASLRASLPWMAARLGLAPVTPGLPAVCEELPG